MTPVVTWIQLTTLTIIHMLHSGYLTTNVVKWGDMNYRYKEEKEKIAHRLSEQGALHGISFPLQYFEPSGIKPNQARLWLTSAWWLAMKLASAFNWLDHYTSSHGNSRVPTVTDKKSRTFPGLRTPREIFHDLFGAHECLKIKKNSFRV